MNIGLIVSLAGIVAMFVIACWQYREATRARYSARASSEKVPAIVGDALKKLVSLARTSPTPTEETSSVWPSEVEFLDVDGDGKGELLIQYPVGAHGSMLQVFAWRQGEFKELASTSSGTPVGFEFGDFDGDGKIEIRTDETDWDSGQPYVSAPRVEILLRLIDGKFAEVSRKRKLG